MHECRGANMRVSQHRPCKGASGPMLPTLAQLKRSDLDVGQEEVGGRPALRARQQIEQSRQIGQLGQIEQIKEVGQLAQMVQRSQYMRVFEGLPKSVRDEVASAVIEAPSLEELEGSLDRLPGAMQRQLDASDRTHVGALPWRRAARWLWTNAQPFVADFTRLVMAGEVAKAAMQTDKMLGLPTQ